MKTGDAPDGHAVAALEHNRAFYARYYDNPLVALRYDLLYRTARIRALLRRSGVDERRPGFAVFEYGFGAAHLLDALAGASRVRGVEASETAVEKVRARWRGRHPDLEVRQWSDASALPHEAASFDLVVCSHVLEHLSDDEAALSELERITRPGGYVLIILPAHEQLFAGSKHLRLYEPSAFAARLLARGLVRVAIDEHQRFDRPWKDHRAILASRRSPLIRHTLAVTSGLAFLPPLALSWRLLSALDAALAAFGAPSTSVAYLFRRGQDLDD